MRYKILAIIIRIFEKKRLKAWAFLGAFLVTWSFWMVLNPYMGPWPPVNLQLSMGIDLKKLANIDTGNEVTSSSHKTGEITKLKKVKSSLVPVCNFSGKKSDFCEIKGDIRIHGKASTIYFTSQQLSMMPKNSTFGIKLYARKHDTFVMGMSKEQKLKLASSEHEMPKCTVNHTIPAVVFSAGGYAFNYFHQINDVMIPLYLTSLEFNREVKFLLAEKDKWFPIEKFEIMFKALSKYEVIDLSHDDEIRCFKSTIVGLKAHDEFNIDPQMPPVGYTLRNFTQFIRRTYSLTRETAIKLKAKENYKKPRLLIIARKNTRSFLNEDEIVAQAQGLGYDVEITDAWSNLKDFSKMVNSFDVMVGVHGAGLTNIIFLPEKAVLIQVVPIALEGISRIFFEIPAGNMNLRYLQYKINQNESSLLDEYPINHTVIVDPTTLFKKRGFRRFKSIYMDHQNVRLNVRRFTTVLIQALELLRQKN